MSTTISRAQVPTATSVSPPTAPTPPTASTPVPVGDGVERRRPGSTAPGQRRSALPDDQGTAAPQSLEQKRQDLLAQKSGLDDQVQSAMSTLAADYSELKQTTDPDERAELEAK